MRFKEVVQVTILAALPIFAMELLAIYRTYKKNNIRMKREEEDEDDTVLEHASLDGDESEPTATSKKGSKQAAGDVNNNVIQEALFFPEEKPPCKDYHLNQNCHKRACTESHDTDSSIGRLAKYILLARDSIDVCQYSVTSSFLAEAILRRQKLGVKVRVITDHEGANILNSQMEEFYNSGIQVRPHRGTGLMHNKFIIIDSAIVATGSFNFTTQAMIDNYENIIVTDQTDVVGRYVQNFARLWRQFDPQRVIRRGDRQKHISAEI